MENEKKDKIKSAFIVFIKAIIPPLVALISSILTTLISGDVGTSTAVGTVLGITSGVIAHS